MPKQSENPEGTQNLSEILAEQFTPAGRGQRSLTGSRIAHGRIVMSVEDWQTRHLTQEEVAALLLQNPDKEYIDGEVVRCKRCGKIRGRIYWGHAPGSPTYTGLAGHIGLPTPGKTDECTCDLRKEQQERQAMAEVQKARTVRILTEQSGLPVRLQDRTFAGLDESGAPPGFLEAAGHAKQYGAISRTVLRKGYGLWITGGPRSGKSSLAAMVAEDWLSQGRSVRYTSVQSAAEAMHRLADTKCPVQTVLDPLRRAQLVIVDNFDRHSLPDHFRSADWPLQRLLTVLDSRYENRLPVILVSADRPDTMGRHCRDAQSVMGHLARFGGGTDGRLLDLGPDPFPVRRAAEPGKIPLWTPDQPPAPRPTERYQE